MLNEKHMQTEAETKTEKCRIFYSWQSDIRESRNFISDCLKRISSKKWNNVIVEVDRDTVGMAGAPNITDAIFGKIDETDLFVADITIINSECSCTRKVSNPNVLMELGYAIKTLGWERIILLYNQDYGDAKDMPFDITHQRMTGYTLQDGKKADSRKCIIERITKTIEILIDQNKLHGKMDELLTAKTNLANLLLEDFHRIHQYVHKRWFTDWKDLNDNFIIVTDAAMNQLETVRACLTDNQYYELGRLLHKLRLAGTGDTDRDGWEYAQELANTYFEPLYNEFGGQMYPLETEEIFTESFIELYNAVSTDKKLTYQAVRYKNGKIVMRMENGSEEAWASNGELLCKGTFTEEGFTGYRVTDRYIGEFLNGKRNGEGKEKAGLYGHYYGCGQYRRTGIWKAGEFAEGTLYAVVVYMNAEGDFEWEDSGDGTPLTADHENMHFFDSGLHEERDAYYMVDMFLKDGVYDVADTAEPRRLFENEE